MHRSAIHVSSWTNNDRVTDLKPTDTADSPYIYTFKVQCTSCRETHPNLVGVSRHEMNELSGSRGEANFVWRCKNCKRESSATIKAAPAGYEAASPARAKNIIEIDTRGLEFTEFKADVSKLAAISPSARLMSCRVNGKQQARILVQNLLV